MRKMSLTRKSLGRFTGYVAQKARGSLREKMWRYGRSRILGDYAKKIRDDGEDVAEGVIGLLKINRSDQEFKEVEELERQLERLQKKKENLLKKKVKFIKNLKKIKNLKYKTHEDIYTFDNKRSTYLNSKRYDRVNKYSRKVFSHESPSKNIGSYFKDVWHSHKIENITEAEDKLIQERAKRVFIEGQEGQIDRYNLDEYKNETLDDLDVEVHIISHSHLDPGWMSTYTETKNRIIS